MIFDSPQLVYNIQTLDTKFYSSPAVPGCELDLTRLLNGEKNCWKKVTSVIKYGRKKIFLNVTTYDVQDIITIIDSISQLHKLGHQIYFCSSTNNASFYPKIIDKNSNHIANIKKFFASELYRVKNTYLEKVIIDYNSNDSIILDWLSLSQLHMPFIYQKKGTYILRSVLDKMNMLLEPDLINKIQDKINNKKLLLIENESPISTLENKFDIYRKYTDKEITLLRLNNIKRIITEESNLVGYFNYLNTLIIQPKSADLVEKTLRYASLNNFGFEIIMIRIYGEVTNILTTLAKPLYNVRTLTLLSTFYFDLSGLNYLSNFINIFALEFTHIQNDTNYEIPKFEVLKTIKTLTHISNSDFNTLTQLLEQTDNLEALIVKKHISTYQTPTKTVNKLKKDLPSLTQLKYHSTNCHNFLSDLISKTINLTALDLHVIDNNINTILNSSLPELRNLTIIDSDFSISFLIKFISQMHQLCKLEIYGRKTIDEPENTLPIFTDLSHIEINNFCYEHEAQIIKNAPNLIKLFINYETDFISLIHSCTVFESVENLEILLTNPYLMIDLSKIFSTFPNLKHFIVNSLHAYITVDTLLKLEEMDINYVTPISSKLETLNMLFEDFSCKNYLSKLFPMAKLSLIGLDDLIHPIKLLYKNNVIASTLMNPTKLNVKEIFYPLSTISESQTSLLSKYRLDLFNQLIIDNINEENFIVENIGDLQLEECKNIINKTPITENVKNYYKLKSDDNNYFHGQQELTDSNGYMKIPSLSCNNELIIHLNIQPSDLPYELMYSRRDNQYYIKTIKNIRVNISFILQVPKLKSYELEQKTLTLPTYLVNMVKELRNYNGSSFKYPENVIHAKSKLEYLIENKVGSCRHRAVAFKYLMAKYDPSIDVRIITNNLHAFVEIYYQNEWLPIELGGSMVEINIIRPQIRSQIRPHQQHKNQRLMINHVEKDEGHEQYLTLFQTWNSVTQNKISIEDYMDECLNENCNIKNRLIQYKNFSLLDTLRYEIYKKCLQTNIPCHMIRYPFELISSTTYLQRDPTDPSLGSQQSGPGGPFYNFNTKFKNQRKIILIDLHYFEKNEYININSLFSKPATIDGLDIDDNTQFIVFQNNHSPQAYNGIDFLSRFHVDREPVPEKSLTEIEFIINSKRKHSEISPEQIYTIDLSEPADWKQTLLGGWEIVNQNGVFTFSYKPGFLSKINDKHLQLILLNAPKSTQLDYILKEAINVGYEHDGLLYKIEPYVNILFKDAFGINKDCLFFTQNNTFLNENDLVSNTYFLNKSEFFKYFDHFDPSIINGLIKTNGIIKRNSGKKINILLNHHINEIQFHQLNSECKKYNVSMNISVFPNVKIPSAISGFIKSTAIPVFEIVENKETLDKFQFINTHDASYSISLINQHNSYFVLDVTEMTKNELLLNVDVQLSNHILESSFTLQDGLLVKLLKNNENVIITGNLDEYLANDLISFLYSNKLTQNIKVVSNLKDGPFIHCKHVTHKFTIDNIYDHVLKNETDAEIIHTLRERKISSYSILNTSLKLMKRELARSTKIGIIMTPDEKIIFLKNINPHAGFFELNYKNHQVDVAIEDAKHKSESFKKERLDNVLFHLKEESYVYLTGFTGVGKTTFVFDTFTKPHQLFVGDNQIKKWALSKPEAPDSLIILLLDEENLSHSLRSNFEGMFHHKKFITHFNELYMLSENHKMIACGNPTSYSKDRKISNFFIEHGCGLIFKPLPCSLIFEDIIKLVFANFNLNDNQLKQIAEPILLLYSYAVKVTKDEILMTPRDIEMVALQVAALIFVKPTFSIEAIYPIISKYSEIFLHDGHLKAFKIELYKMRGTVVIERQLRSKRRYEDGLNKFLNPDVSDHLIILNQKFVLTKSRKPIMHIFEQLLIIRRFRQSTNNLNRIQKFGGLGGLFIEGDSAIGKTELILKLFEHYKLIKDVDYFIADVGTNIEKLQSLIDTAFHQGGILLINELNTYPSLEQDLNARLMGRTKDGVEASKPGFMLICTQNPSTSFEARIKESNALKRRTISIKLPPYTQQELSEIINHKIKDIQKARLISRAFLFQLNIATKYNLNPVPTLRLIENIDKKLEAAKVSIEKNTTLASQMLIDNSAEDKGQPTKKIRPLL